MPNSIAVHPSTTDDLAELMKAESAMAHRMLIRGATTAFDWGGRAEPADIVIDTTALTGLLRHEPEDMTVSARAGTTLRELQTVLVQHRQRVAMDPARQTLGATLGGLIATADSGPLRQAFGSLRTLVIGMTFVLADGTVAHSGGQVIKNVAGYDLGKLLHGSLGTLGVVTEVVLRLHPAPAATATVCVPASVEEAPRVARDLVRAGIEPVSLEWSRDTLHVRLEGTVGGTEDRTHHVLAVAGCAEVLSTSVADAAWQRIAEVSIGAAGDTVLRVGTTPLDSSWLVKQATQLARKHDTNLSLTSSVGVGVHTLRLRGGEQTAFLEDLRQQLIGHKAVAVVCRPDGLGAAPTRTGCPPPGVEVMRAIKTRFDPNDLLGNGRFTPWF